MSAIELVSTQATAPGTGAVFAAVAGNTLTVRDTRKEVYLISLWQQRQAAGFTRVTSPLLHDAVVGFGGGGGIGSQELFRGWTQPLRAQDTIIVTGSGSAVAGQIETSCYLVWYEDLPGSSQHLITWDELQRRGEAMYSPSNTLALGTAGGYSGSELVTAEEDQLKANREYAWVGTAVQVGAAAIRLTGTDFGNLGLGHSTYGLSASAGDGRHNTGYWAELARELDAPLIPVMNSSNKSNTFLDGITDQTGTDAVVKLQLVLLAPSSAGGRRVKK